MKSQVISDTVEFHHSYLSVPVPSTEDRIIHGLQVVARALTGAAPPTSISQVDAIANLRDIFESWHLLAPPACRPTHTLMPGCPSVPTNESPRVILLPPPTPSPPRLPIPSGTPLPRPAASTLLLPPPSLPCFQATPQRLNFSSAPSPRVVIQPRHPLPLPPLVLPTPKPISHRTCSRALAPLVLFTAGQPFHKCVTYQIPITKSIRSPAELIGFAGRCKAMQPAEVDGFAYLCKALMLVGGPAHSSPPCVFLFRKEAVDVLAGTSSFRTSKNRTDQQQIATNLLRP
jgi:hypothetical protein